MPNILLHITSQELDRIKGDEYFEGYNQGAFDVAEWLIAEKWISENDGKIIRENVMKKRED